ncbi:MAG TPA: histidine kinase dimerization/phosphoacceptor domain -containing protein [Spirochaetota bacterium]|nr:histidine kinase dimerization/phosphoacceptor domain -containing protein [Spirochaetota bacterium]HPC43139.1 histidine kinase dimerization/phosphoacceptor domain -containing protein [Spirochaetota bacterium]HPL17363.1 histidine kinase dimerization/phosphoacceptor domain -containing protein [Spirochaetota bacterium]HQF10508.1 histidine kinase dimerization/phosphoacceptor domain -containing protein [Spirochaetota bacterium]HQH99515.1 histidine kinase dimerization/phosphoacceptor domain -contai
MRSIRFTFILLEGLTLAVALLFSILLLYILQDGIKDRYISSHVTSMETIEIMVENYLDDNMRAFKNFIDMPDKEGASRFIPVYSDIYYCSDRLHVTVIITKEAESHIFPGYDLGKSNVGLFLANMGSGSLHHSPMYRSPENDGLSVYIATRYGNGFLVGRIGMEKFRDYLARIAGYANSIITLATKDGYILFSTDKSFHVNMLPSRTDQEIEISGQKYLYTRKHSEILDNYIAMFTPLSTVYLIVRTVQYYVIVFAIIIFVMIIAKITWQSLMIMRPLGSLGALLGAWDLNRAGEEVPGKFISYDEISSVYDIFQEKSIQINNAVAALRESEEKFRTTIAAMVDQVFVFNGEGAFVLCHTPGADDAGAFAGAVVGKTYSEVMDGETAQKFNAAFDANKRGDSSEFDLSIEKTAGTRWYSVRVSPNRINDAYGGSIAVVRDITERKMAEQQAQLDLMEKDILLKEIHHRVKNNLNVITSLLNLQSDQIGDREQAIEAFRESRNRIFSMALVHEKLYQTKSFSQVNFKEYIEDMTGELIHAYALGEHVSIAFDVEEIMLDINVAIPCGLILNELVSNALKHAFTENTPGRIAISLKSAGGGALELEVSDSGKGLPEGFAIVSAKSLGLQLVNLLSKQIGGALTVESARGAIFKIRFAGQP